MSKPKFFRETGVSNGYYAKKEASSKSCLCCGDAFLTKQPHRAIFCSNKCQWRQRQREAAVVLRKIKMERGCAVCGYKEHPAALDFDHTRGTKRRQVGKSPTVKFLMEEMDKCTILCANCHRIKTFDNKEYFPINSPSRKGQGGVTV